MSISQERASRISSSSPYEFDLHFLISQNENDIKYPPWTTWRELVDFLVSLPENVTWHAVLCILTLLAILFLSMDYETPEEVFGLSFSDLIDVAYNALYGLHAVARMINDCYRLHHEQHEISRQYWLWYILDAATYVHYGTALLPSTSQLDIPHVVKMTCYYVRLRRPLQYLWAMSDYYLKCSVISTVLKYWYIFVMMRLIYSNAFVWLGMTQVIKYIDVPDWLKKKRASLFYRTFYMIDKTFLTIGLDWTPDSDFGRLASLVVMMSGTMMATGVAVASLAIVISVHLRPEETFRSRFRLIADTMKETSVPILLRQKVETFYNMYWHKQKAVSATQLLPTYPPTLISSLYTDIYFEAFQKSQILCDLSYQFLSELAKHMKTINYIPGDFIVERNISKFAVVYISYGDVEVMTAEDDVTPILRFTRGSILNPCGACVDVASSTAHVSVRAATFCTAHVLRTADLWRVAAIHGKINSQSYNIHASFYELFQKVKVHYSKRPRKEDHNKSSIQSLKRNLIELKEGKDEHGKPLMDDTNAFVEIANCYVMRNQPDASLLDESDEICLKPTFPCILQPSSSLQIMWKLFVAGVALAATFIHPYYIVFLHRSSVKFIFFDFIVTVINFLDIIVHLSTGVFLQEGVPVSFLETSSQQMRSVWIVLDVLSVAPVFYFVFDGEFVGMNKIFKLPKVFRTLKEMEHIGVCNIHLLRFFSVCILTITITWLVAALNYSILCFGFRYCYIGSLVEKSYWSTYDTKNRTDSDLMVFNMYWSLAITTFTSHLTDTFSRPNWQIQAIVILVLEICATFHILAVSAYSASIMVTESMREDYNKCIETVKQFLERNYIDPVLRQRFVNYLQLCWYTDKAYGITHEESSILFDLPRLVYQDISAMQRNKYLLCIPFMKALPPSMLKSISSKARLFYTSPNEILLNTGDMSNEIYVIKQGFCEVLDPITKKVISIITTKSHFSDLECLIRVPVYYTVRAVTHVQVFSVSRKDLMKAIASSQIKDVIAYTKSQPEYQTLVRKRCEQFFKYEMPPPPPNREIFPLLRKHEPDEAFLVPFQRLGFFAISKYIFPRFTIRPDGQYLRRYEWFRAFCAFLSAFMPSLNLLTLQFSWIYYFSIALDYSAYFDVIQRMLVGYYDEKGILIYHPVSTAFHYFRGAMIVDLLACLPLEHLASIDLYLFDVNGKHIHTLPREMQYMMFNRCLQLYRLPKALDFLHNYIRRDIIYIIKAIPIFIVFINVIAMLCIIFSVTQFVVEDRWTFIIPKTTFPSWILTDAANVGYNVTGTPLNLWLTTFYWATNQLTTTGFDLFKPHCRTLIITFIVAMTIGLIMTMYIAVRVLSIRSNVNQALADFQGNIGDMVTFMKRERLHKDLQHEILSHYEYKWEKTGGTGYRSVFKLCDQITLRTDAILHIYGKTFRKCPILYKCDLSVLRLLGRAVHSVYFCPGTVMIERDDVISELFFIDYGTVEARDPEDDDHVVTELPRGSLFGNLDHVNRVVCPNSFVVNTSVHLLKIDAILFYNILQDFPSIRERVMRYRPDEENYIIGHQHSQSAALSTWKQRAASSVIMAAQRTGVLKYLLSQGKIIQIYFIAVCLVCVFLDVYNAAFKHNGKHLIRVLYAMDVAFIPKIVLNLLIMYIKSKATESEIAVKKFRKKYLLGEFKYDIISLLPLELFCLLAANKWKVYPYLRLNRFFRMVTVHSCLTRYKRKLTINLPCVTMASAFIWFTLFIHTTTCLWYVIGCFEDNRRPRTSWRWNRTNQYVCFSNQYICSMYFVLGVFTQMGADDILPRQQSEVVFVCALMIMSTMMYMIYVGEFSNIIHYQFNRCFTFYSKYLELQEFLKNNRVAHNLVTPTKKYTLHLWREARGQQIPYFLITAPQCLRLKVMSAAYMKHLRKIPAFKHCEPMFLRQLVGHLQPFYYDENMYVVREGELTNSMYFIHKGCVQQLNEAQEIEIEMFQAKTHFGTIQGLFRGTAYFYSYKTKIKSQVLTLSLDSWEYLLKHFPNNKDIISKYYAGPGSSVKKQRKNKSKSSIISQDSNKERQSRARFDIPIERGKELPETTRSFAAATNSDREPQKSQPETQDSGSPWPLDSRNKSSFSMGFSEDSYVTPKPSNVVLRRKSAIFKEVPDLELTSLNSNIAVSPTSPTVVDLTKSSSKTELKQISLTKAKPFDKVHSLLPPPAERLDHVESFSALQAESQHLEPLPKEANPSTTDALQDKPTMKKIKMISKPEEIEITQSLGDVRSTEHQLIKATTSGLDDRKLKRRSLSIQSAVIEPIKKVRISEGDSDMSPKAKRSTLAFKDTITTFEVPKSDITDSNSSIINMVKEKDEEEANIIAGVLSAMSVHSIGDVEGYIMEQSNSGKNKRNSKEKRDSKEKRNSKEKQNSKEKLS